MVTYMPPMRPLIIAAAVVALFASVTPAQATSITDTYDPTDVFFLMGGAACTGTNPDHSTTGDVSSAGNCASLQFTHLISPEFNPALHQLIAPTTLTLYYRDDETGQPESYTVSLDAGTAVSQQITSGPGALSNYSYDVLALMSLDGTLTVNLVRAGNNNSDYFSEKPVVVANYVPKVTATPEPASMILLGSGLAAIGARLRRRRTETPLQ
jgi:hypothetical protein